MAFSTRNSVFAIVEESGSPISPSSGDQFIALQEGFEVTASFETLENAELTGSIGAVLAVEPRWSPRM